MRRLFACLILLLSHSALAFVPAPGLWNTDAIDGQGFNIETQNDVMIVTAYVFDQAGNQIWYLAVGTYSEATSTFTGTLANAVGGSCLTCPYKPPTAKSGNAGGTLKIAFQSRENGVATINGGSARAITHFNYGYNGKTGYFFGEWQFSFNVLGLVDAQWVVFPGATYLGSDGKTYAQGYLDGKQASTAALAIYDSSSDVYVVVIDDNTGYIITYGFYGDNGRMIGLGWIEPSGTPISGNGSPAAGNRILVQSELVPGINPLSVPTYTMLQLERAASDATDLKNVAGSRVQ